MKISIITPCWNSETTILRTLESIKGQRYSNIEWIIIDNLSSDKTLYLIRENYLERKSRELLIFSEEDKGISDAFNKGLLASSGEIIGILNSDDCYNNEEVLSNVAAAFERDQELMFVHGDMLFIDEEHGTNRRRPLQCSVDYAMPFNHPTMFFRKEVYEKYGLFKLDYRYAMDFEFILRFHPRVNICSLKGLYIPEVLVDMHAGGVSDRMETRSIDDVERALREHGLWSNLAFFNLTLRRLRIRLKSILKVIGLSILVKFWRKYKWS